MNLFSRTKFGQGLAAAMTDPNAVAGLLPLITLPDNIRQWLTRLMLLNGVPINYLVPDEGMLPPESIRFFYVNMNWVDAMIDGAFSIGRGPSSAGTSASQNIDRAAKPTVRSSVRENASTPRARAFGNVNPQPANLQVVSGFLLRSSVVAGYPGLGVNAYPKGGTPNDPTITLLPILRLEQLGPHSDTLICLIDGDAAQIDIHEPPEGLHYGIDSFSISNGVVTASKGVHTFTQSGSTITMSPNVTPLPNFETCFRTASPRTIMMTQVASLLSAANAGQPIDSASMGFEMTEGVGQVSFLRSGS